MPKNSKYYFRFLFCFQPGHATFPPNGSFSISYVFHEMPHFSQLQNQIGKMAFEGKSILKMGHFDEKARDHVKNRKRTENETLRIFG